jgi:hypothetical protein
MTTVTSSVARQLDELECLGVFEGARHPVVAAVDALRATLDEHDSTLVGLHPSWFAASRLAPLMQRAGKPGFVVEDMVDVDEFLPVGIDLPDSPVYLVRSVSRGDDLQNASPEEALARFSSEGRRPLTLHEGLSWALTHPEIIEANNCFMTIGSRKAKSRTRAGQIVYDARTPALWNASGTGRDGIERRGAPKLGWCWWRNRHTWLGIASAAA